ncbi:cation:proton antiporter [Salisaeta longa]|uniref:cation:proton antiporter n=1 Tax=Salisaeta longa TaxID=503170 RepID=UPI0003B60431|nr:sodium:proton antiporter [Salisaeta longa]
MSDQANPVHTIHAFVPESILLDITTVIVLGVGAQWLAWRFRLPSILLLLLAGFLAGPVLQILSPTALQQDWLFAFVSLSIGIILFEGGLSLRLSELREVGSTVRNLITVGVLVTWALGTLGAFYLLDFGWSLAILVGAILTVTGPTVVIPLLRHIRPKGRVSTVAKWEGITIDPVGAILAVLVLETLLLLETPTQHATNVAAAAEHVAIGLGLAVFVALGVSIAATALLVVILQRRLVPDFLRNPMTLMIVAAAFVTSNVLQEESGLLATTIMGIALANQPYVSVQRIVEFKENLQVLLIGSLFILLSARLEMSALQYIDGSVLLFLALLVFVVRPLAVWISSFGTPLEWGEKIFLSWLAPRGIVAAAVASLFAFKLEPIYPQQVGALVPVVFAVIVGTVATYGLTAGPLARWLDLADPNPQGLLFVGANRWVRMVARFVQDLGFDVKLIDTNPDNVEESQAEGLTARRANALSEAVLDDVDLSGVGRVLITIPNEEVAALAALHFSEVFESTDIYQLSAKTEKHAEEGEELPRHLRGRPLFGERTTYQDIERQVKHGATLKVFKLSDDFPTDERQEYYTLSDILEEYKDHTITPLFLVRSTGTLEIVSEAEQFTLRPDDRFVALVDHDGPASTDPAPNVNQAVFEMHSLPSYTNTNGRSLPAETSP